VYIQVSFAYTQVSFVRICGSFLSHIWRSGRGTSLCVRVGLFFVYVYVCTFDIYAGLFCIYVGLAGVTQVSFVYSEVSFAYTQVSFAYKWVCFVLHLAREAPLVACI